MKRLREVLIETDEDEFLPRYQNPGDAGCDLVSAEEEVHIEPGKIAVVNTGIKIAVPQGWVGLIHPRSGLAAKHGLTVVNTPGTIDSGYRGPIKVALINLGHEIITVKRGTRIAQLLFQEVIMPTFVQVDSLAANTARGEGGFGSTGTT